MHMAQRFRTIGAQGFCFQRSAVLGFGLVLGRSNLRNTRVPWKLHEFESLNMLSVFSPKYRKMHDTDQ